MAEVSSLPSGVGLPMFAIGMGDATDRTHRHSDDDCQYSGAKLDSMGQCKLPSIIKANHNTATNVASGLVNLAARLIWATQAMLLRNRRLRRLSTRD